MLKNLHNKIINADSLKELKKIPDETFDLIFADPPYNLQLQNSLIRPDRSKVNMFVPFMTNYNKLLVDTCHKRGAFGMGGMSAQVIAKANPKEINEKALDIRLKT